MHGVIIAAGLVSAGWGFVEEEFKLNGDQVPLSVGPYLCEAQGRTQEVSVAAAGNNFKVTARNDSLIVAFEHVGGDRYLVRFNRDVGVVLVARIGALKFEHLNPSSDAVKKHAEKAGVKVKPGFFQDVSGTAEQKKAFYQSIARETDVKVFMTCRPKKQQ